MIAIKLSEAEIFDRLTILEVKHMNSLNVEADRTELRRFLFRNLGTELMDLVLRSWEYQELLESNFEVFKLVDKATRDECKASEVDKANQRRYNAKKELQERFWPTEPLTEVKSKRPK